ncbi:MAG: hypothetical protein AAF570_00665 [Bacteroidota bacterium]
MKSASYNFRAAMLLSLLLMGLSAIAQNQNIGGVINTYAQVTSIVPEVGNLHDSIAVPNTALFSAGDRILVYQAKGATIDQTNTAAYGSITNIGCAGCYEFAQITGIANGKLATSIPLNSPFDVTGKVQVVRVPETTGTMTITSTLTAPAYNNTNGTGGIVALICDTLSFMSPIDVRGLGFAGGLRSNNSNQWHYEYFSVQSNVNGRKGGGIAEHVVNQEGARGRLATGGGGGNQWNGGGGGGSNFGAGGLGGWPTVEPNTTGGFGGLGMSAELASDCRIFFGGGGGGGARDNSAGSDGVSGGGIVFIQANVVIGNSSSINADGNSVVLSASGDGAGGGGAGGSVFINASEFLGSITVNVNGGSGGNYHQFHTHGCGGGGGGGAVLLSNAAQPAGLTVMANGGVAGVNTSPSVNPNPPAAGSNGALPGDAGGTIFSKQMLGLNLAICPSAALPVAGLELRATPEAEHIALSWDMAWQRDLAGFTLERAHNDGTFQQILWTNASSALSYTTRDRDLPTNGTLYYRLSALDLNGDLTFSNVVEVELNPRLENFDVIHYHLQHSQLFLNVRARRTQPLHVTLLSTDGKILSEQSVMLDPSNQGLLLTTPQLSSGVYLIRLQAGSQLVCLKTLIP